MKTQSHIQDDLAAYALGSLESSRVGAVRKHLRSCRICREELAELDAAIGRLDQAQRPVEPPRWLEASLVRSLPGRSTALRGWTLAALVGLVAVLAAGNIWQWQTSPVQGWKDRFLVALLKPASGEALGTLVLDPGVKKGVLAVRDLPGPGRYRLWVLREAQWTSVGVFSIGSDGYGSLNLMLPGDVQSVEAFCVAADEGLDYLPDAWVLKGTL